MVSLNVMTMFVLVNLVEPSSGVNESTTGATGAGPVSKELLNELTIVIPAEEVAAVETPIV